MMNTQPEPVTYTWTTRSRVDIVEVVEVCQVDSNGRAHPFGTVEARWPEGKLVATSHYTPGPDGPRGRRPTETYYGVQPHEAAARIEELAAWVRTEYEKYNDQGIAEHAERMARSLAKHLSES